MLILQSYFPSYNYQQDRSAYYDYWIILQIALKIAASNLYCKITLVWLNSSLSADKNSLPGKQHNYRLWHVTDFALRAYISKICVNYNITYECNYSLIMCWIKFPIRPMIKMKVMEDNETSNLFTYLLHCEVITILRIYLSPPIF